MKTCAWCGRENNDDATRCAHCGTEFAHQLKEPKPSQPRDWSWIKGVCVYGGASFLAVLLYFLSLGPVIRFSATVSQTVTTNGTSFTFQRAAYYPGWVGIVYSPAFSLLHSGSEDTLSDFYWRYLQWWEPPPTNK